MGGRDDQIEHLACFAAVHELLFAVADQINAVTHLVLIQKRSLVPTPLVFVVVTLSEVLPKLCMSPVDHLLLAIQVVLCVLE